MRTWPALVLLAVLALDARAEISEEARALARKAVEAHRSEGHRARFEVVFPEVAAVPSRGQATVEARRGRYALEETEVALVVSGGGARLVLVSRTHLPVFAARAARKRDAARLLEARVPLERARAFLLALELVASGHERPRERGHDEPLDPRFDEPEETSEAPWPVLRVAGRVRRGAFAEIGRLLLEDLGKECGLAPPVERDAALQRLVPLAREGDARAQFVLGEAAFTEAWPALRALETEEARSAREKIEALAGPGARGRLVALSTRSRSWDVRSWAREKLTRADWIAALLAAKDAPEDALVEALSGLEAGDAERAEAIAGFLTDSRALVRVEAAAALLRFGDGRGKDALAQVAGDGGAAAEARETAIARLAAALSSPELATVLSPIVADPEVPASVRAEAARSLDQAQATSATSALVRALDGELARATADEAAHDLRLALIAALASVGHEEAALRALGRAAALEPTDDARALAIHAAGALGAPADTIVKAASDAENARQNPSLRARRAALVETAVRSDDEKARLFAIADAVCEAPLRTTLDRLVRAARDSKARAVLVERLKAHGEEGEAGLALLGGR